MNNLEWRIERPLEKLGAKSEPRVMVITNVPPGKAKNHLTA